MKTSHDFQYKFRLEPFSRQTGKNLEKFIFRLIFYLFCIILNGSGKFIFRCCPRRKRLIVLEK
jgi:hypothetical protein